MHKLSGSHYLPHEITLALAESKHLLLQLYQDRLKDLILFGSYARGDFTPESDLDLLLLLSDLPNPAAERKKYLPVACELSLKYDSLVSIIPMDYTTYKTKRTPLILNIHREGLKL